MAARKVSILRVFKSILWPKRKVLFLGLSLILISKAAGFVAPVSLQYLVDDILPKKDIYFLTILLITVILAYVMQAATSFLLIKVLSVHAQRVIFELRVEVQKKILFLPVRFFDNIKSGQLVSRIMTDVEGVSNLIGAGFVQLIGGLFTSVISLVLLFFISPSMTLFALIPLTIFSLIALKAFKVIRPIFRNQGKINAHVTGRLVETIGGIRVIKAFNAELLEQIVFENGAYRLFNNTKKSLSTIASITCSSTLLVGFATTGVMGLGSYYIMMDFLSLGGFLSFTFLLGLMITPIIQMSEVGTQMIEALAGLDRTEELMNEPPESNVEKRNIILESVKGNLIFKNVSFAYEHQKRVLHNISFSVNSGDIIALVGSSGSGKSTIAGLTASFLVPNSGCITIDGVELSKVNLASFRKHVGIVLQDDFLFEGTIRENILFSRPDATMEQLQRAVNTAYVNEFTDRFDAGLETLIGERGIKLSGGQRQRIAIARAVLANSKILILDEATSNLDTESEALIQKSLNRLMKGRTTVVIAHRLSTVKKADLILVLEKGRITERGTHRDLMKLKGRYFKLFTEQMRI